MLTADSTLQEIMNAPELKGRGYMVDPGVDALLKTMMGEAYDTVLGGRTFTQIALKEIPNVLTAWNLPSLVVGLEYLLQKAGEGKVFYDIWNEKEMKEEPSRRETGISAFIVPGGKKFVLVCPGGGYSSVCTVAEGYGIAKEWNDKGYSAFILQYRVGDKMQQPKQIEDLVQAVKYIFAHAEELQVDTKDYALMGFSAGAHLASCFGTELLGYKKYGLQKPGAVILGYPVITMGEKTHEGSRKFLLGTENIEDQALRAQFSIEKQITSAFPSTYVWQCEEDETVPIENSQMLVDALKEKKIPYEYEVFPGNAHGWGVGIGTAAEGWIDRAITFWERQWAMP